MNIKTIQTIIGRAIREGKYLKITYKNQENKITNYWVCALDICSPNKLSVYTFNENGKHNYKTTISISEIQQAEIVKFSHYDVPGNLLKKIEHDENLQIYNYDKYNNNILNYYLECYKANIDPFLYKSNLINGIDKNELLKNNPYNLSDVQQKQIIKEIYNNNYKKNYVYELALCEFSIDMGSKKLVVAFKKLTYDPIKKELQIGRKTYFNQNFYCENVKYSLSHYTNLESTDFEEAYLDNKSDIIELLRNNFKKGELLNTRPEIIILGYSQIDISKIYDGINSEHSKNEMQIPLKTFFQNLSLLDRKNRTEPQLVLYDNNVNIDQLRTIYNALKYPITYVQGPPGTGKTQTIINIIINCLTNNKTLLISSNNNTPIDGIKEKLNFEKYKNKEILLPIIRLGNNKYTATALKKIKNLYEFETKDIPKEELLLNLKEKSKEKNKALLVKLKNYEDCLDLTQNLDFINKLLSNGEGKSWFIEQEKKRIEEQLIQIPKNTDDNLKGIFEIVKNNNDLLQYFYFDSLKYIKRLKNKNYSDLIEILYLQDEEEQVNEFNKWLVDDNNLKKLTKVFPIILTTNISSRRLGVKFKFDLLAIDEAGQCDLATGLIPISKSSNMVLIGDTNQLKPIVVFEETKNDQLMKQFDIEEIYNYFNNSILSTYKRIDNISRNILLSYHYRCGKRIINYSNMRFYENKLNLSAIKISGEVKLLDVNNINQKEKNSQLEEAKEIINYIKKEKLSDVFIVTPFRNQEKVINYFLNLAKEKKELDNSINCGTIHKIQGQENKTIIISTAISRQTNPRTYNWIKNNSNLLNVGVTRAKERLIVVTDKQAINILSKKDDDLYALIDYVDKNGTTEISQSIANKLTIGFSNDSQFENEFYKTMSQYCSIQGSYFKRNVKIIELFPEEKNNYLVNKKEFDGVLYKNNVPKIIFELNGKEHYTDKNRIKSDKIKKKLAEEKKIKLIFIPNEYVKHYEFVKELINKFNQKSWFDI